MPPPVVRYGQIGPFSHIQQQQQPQQHHPSHAQNSGLPPSLGGHPGFGPGNPTTNSNINPFAISGSGVGISNGISGGGFGGGGGGTGDVGGGTGLASQAAQMGFARGAQMQQQQHAQHGHEGHLSIEVKAGSGKSRIRDVWKNNLAQEMQVLRGLVERYPYISMVSISIDRG